MSVMCTEDLSFAQCTWNGKADSCPMCSGECCNFCGAGCWSNETNCQHDSLTRHQFPPNTLMDGATRPQQGMDGVARPQQGEASP